MSDEIEQLNKREKSFLAGSIKKMILANASISEQEVDDLSGRNPDSPFPAYEESLAEFEEMVKSEKDYWNYAESITDPQAQDVILKFIYNVSLKDGYMSGSEAHFYRHLEKLWLDKG